MADMIGPIDDPSISDCLMVLTLPDQVPGCTRLDADLHSDEAPTLWKDPAFSPERASDHQR